MPAPRPAASFTIIGLGVLAGPLDAAVNVAFPAITAAFALPLQAIQWVVIAYMLTYSSLILLSGRLGDLFGYRRVFRIGIAVSAAALLACALAPSYGWLLAGRALQGAGIAMAIGCSPALALSVYPETERTRVLARLGALVAFGLALGPLAGGVLVELAGWRAVFWIRVPLLLAALALLARVPVAPVAAQKRAFDAPGAALLVAGTSLLLLALALPGAAAAALGALALAVTAAFVHREARIAEPMLQPRLFAHTGFALVNLSSVAINFAGFVVFLLGPYWFVRIAGLSALSGGVLLAFAPAGALAGAALCAPLLRRASAYRVAAGSAALAAIGLAVMTMWTPATGVVAIAALLFVQGLGIGTFQVAYSDIVVAALPPQDRGVAGSLANLTRTLGVVGSAALLSALHRAASETALAAGLDAEAAFVAGFRVAAGWATAVLGVFAGAMLLYARRRLSNGAGGAP